jgi:hypothetical protein
MNVEANMSRKFRLIIRDKCQPDPAYEAGKMTAKYLPADPAVWFDAASAADYWVFCKGGWMGMRIDGVPHDAQMFLNGWLDGTPGGREALGKFLDDRGIHRFPQSFTSEGESFRPRGGEPEVS